MKQKKYKLLYSFKILERFFWMLCFKKKLNVFDYAVIFRVFFNSVCFLSLKITA